ncbi:MAG TPA: ABC transporter permease [Terriglobia bacterium]|nr:ABC transporter permease [Terriglobia bacterium]
MTIWRRLKYLLPSYRRAEERDLQDELESLRAIAGPRELGNLTIAAENARAVRAFNWLDSVGQDVRYGWRTLLRHRRVTAVALLSLALGIGANTLVFSLINVLLLRPFPYRDPDQVVKVGFTPANNPTQLSGLTRGNCISLGRINGVFDQFGCYTDPASASIADDNSAAMAPERLTGIQLTAGVPRVLGVNPILGRWFTDAEEEEGADRVVVISYGLWQRRFGGNRDVPGKMVRFDSEPAAIIGVMPVEFEFIDPRNDYWIPFRSPAYGAQSPARILSGLARLRPRVEISRAQSEMDALALQLAEESPESNKGWGIQLRHLMQLDEMNLTGQYRSALWTALGAVAFVLLIACANVAGLLLAQGTSQQKEVALRSALGSGRWRIFRQLLTHSILLSGAGGVLGAAVGWTGVQLLRTALPPGLPQAVYQTHLDPTVFLFTLTLSLSCGLIVGIAPALQISHAHPLDAMRESGRSATSGLARQRLRSMFVAGQIALALVLLVGAGLMLHSLLRLGSEPLGFDPDNLLTLDVQLPEGKFRRPTTTVLASGALEMEIHPQIYLTSERIRQNLAAIPGVIIASGIAIRPPMGGSINMPVRIEGQQSAELPRAQFLPVLPDYFKTLGIGVTQGREFGLQDTLGSLPIAVVNESLARRYWPNENPLGKHIQIDTSLLPNQPVRQVVGVVSEVMQYPGQDSRPQLYVPYGQMPPEHDERLSNEFRRITFVIKTLLPTAEIAGAAIAAVARADSSQAVYNIRTMRQTAYNSLQRRRVYVALIGIFGIIAVLLAVVGVYGVMAQVVSQRTTEIGIRIALGADPAQVRSFVIRQGSVLIGAGLLIGTAGALAVARALRSALFGVTATDPLTFAAGILTLGGIALLACYLPARRASRIDPTMALRHE